MSVRRRLFGFTASLAVAATLAVSARADGPPLPLPSPGRHEPLRQPLTPEQVRDALSRLGMSGSPGLPGGLPPEMLDAALRELQRSANGKGLPKLDPKQLAELKKQFDTPEMRKKLDELRRDGKLPTRPEDAAQLLKMFEGMPKDPFGFPQPGPGTQTLPKFEPGTNRPAVPKSGPTPPKPDTRPPTPPTPNGEPGPGTNPDQTDRPALTPPDPAAKSDPDIEPQRPPFLPTDGPETPREKAARTAASLWERAVGPLDDTPAVKDALLSLVRGTEDWTDGNGNNFWDTLSKEGGDSTSFADFIDDAARGDSWQMPKFDGFQSFNFDWGRSNLNLGRGSLPDLSGGGSWWSGPRAPSAPSWSSSGSGWSFGSPGSGGSWLPVVLLAATVIGLLVVWRFWYLRGPREEGAFGPGGLGRWPVDPRRLASRRDVVLAFEYLSVLICGAAAKTWTHTTIARALAELATTHGGTATLLARLYEFARYSPADEPLTAGELAEARRLVCRLAGLGDE